MKGGKRSYWLHALVLVFMGLSALACKPTPTPTSQQGSTSQGCHGDLLVDRSAVARVTPKPKVNYQVAKTYTWSAPYGVEVTGSGKGTLQVYDALNKLLSKFSVYAAVTTNGQVTVKEWNGLKTITFDAGNFYVQDSGGQDQCNLSLLAHGVGITSVSTEYVITVRPDVDEVTVAVLDGVVSVTSQGATVNLDAQVPDEQLVVISGGNIGPLQPVPDPGRLLEDVITGGDIFSPEPPEEIPQPPGSLTIWADVRLLPVLEELGAQYEGDTGINVLIDGMPQNEIVDRFFSATEAGNPPDLLTLPHAQLYELVESGLLLPVEPGISPDLLVPGTIQAFSVNGVPFGAPYVFTNLALVSNLEYVREIPPTWSALSEYTAGLSRGREFFTGLMIPADGYHFFPVQSAFGGYIFGTSSDGSYNPGDIGMDSGGSLAAAAWLEELVNTQAYFPGDEETAIQNFLGGNAAIILTGPWSLPRLREAGINYQIHPFPGEGQESQPLLSADGFVISSASQAPDHAQEFLLRYLTTPEAVLAYSRFLEVPPARRDVLDNLVEPDLYAFGLAGVNGVPIPNIPEMQHVWEPWSQAVEAIMAQELSAEEAFIDAASRIRESIGQ